MDVSRPTCARSDGGRQSGIYFRDHPEHHRHFAVAIYREWDTGVAGMAIVLGNFSSRFGARWTNLRRGPGHGGFNDDGKSVDPGDGWQVGRIHDGRADA